MSDMESDMQRAADSADRVAPSWTERAIERVVAFGATTRTFMIEDVRSLAEREEFPRPPTLRAWGAAASVASKRGLIVRAGVAWTTQTKTANPTLVTVWRLGAAKRKPRKRKPGASAQMALC